MGDRLTSKELQSNFIWFATQFAINHGVVTTPLVISTSVLDKNVAYTGNAVLNIFTVVSAFFLGAPLCSVLGLKGSLLFGMFLYCIYAGLFAVAAGVGTGVDGPQVVVQSSAFWLGSACGGVAAGVLWTAQGGYFARTVDLLLPLQDEARERSELTSTLAATFAMFYLSFEVLAKLSWSLLDFLKVPGWTVAAIFTAIGALALLGMTKVRDITVAGPPVSWSAKIKAAATLWSDPSLVLLSGSNITFGFSAAFMNGYVNGNFTKNELGAGAVPMLAALTAALAAGFSRLFGPLGARFGKGPVVVIGGACFLGIPFCISVLGCCSGWRWALIILYVLQGAGRAVYESTNKGIFTDFFPNDSVGAFANCMLQSSLAFALCFFLSSVLKGALLEAIVTVLAILMPCGYGAAWLLRRRQHTPGEEVGIAARLSSS